MRDSHEWLLILCAALCLCGCSRSGAPSPAGEADSTSRSEPDAAAPMALPGESTSEPPAESGLAIKRGVVTLASDRATFTACGDETELWLLDQTDGVLTRTFGGETPNAPTMLYIEAYGERAPPGEDLPAAHAYTGVFVLEEVLYAGLQGEVKGCAAPEPTYIVQARGNEPFWAAEVNDAQIVWRQPDEPKEIILSAAQVQDAEGAVRYRASGAGHEVDVLIDARACRDGMSGEFFAYSAKAMLDGKEFNGCARVGR